jgi:hypothetical protein
MKTRAVALLAVVAALVGVASGCRGPRLVSRPLTEEQCEWASIIRTSYPGWRPPYYTTVVPRSPDLVPQMPYPVDSAFPAAARQTEAERRASAEAMEFVPAEPAR